MSKALTPNDLSFLLRSETSLHDWRVKPQQKTGLNSILAAPEHARQDPFAFSIVGPCGSTNSMFWPEASKQPLTAPERPDHSLGPADVQSYRDPEQPLRSEPTHPYPRSGLSSTVI